MDLPEFTIGEAVQMIPLPGDRTDIWCQGVCLRKVDPQSYLVEVEGSLYRRNQVDLRLAELLSPHDTMTESEVLNHS